MNSEAIAALAIADIGQSEFARKIQDQNLKIIAIEIADIDGKLMPYLKISNGIIYCPFKRAEKGRLI